MNQQNEESKAKIQLIISLAIFGSIGIFVRLLDMPSSLIAFFRAAIGAAFLLLLIVFKKENKDMESYKKALPYLAISGIMIATNWMFLFESYRFTTVAISTLCYYMAPIFLIIASPIILKEKITLKSLICTITALIGMVSVSGVLSGGMPDISELKGIILGLVAAFFYACVILTNKKVVGIEAKLRTATQLTSAGIIMIPYILLTENIGDISLDLRSIIILVIVGGFNTGFVYALYFDSLSKLKSRTVAILSYIDPVVAIILSALILKERPDIWTILGAVLILGSALICELPIGEKDSENREIS